MGSRKVIPMPDKEVKPEDLGEALADRLIAFTEDVAEAVKADVDLTMKELLKKVKADAPVRTGTYKKSIRAKLLRENFYTKVRILYVKNPHYKLTHLLDNGHKNNWTGKRVKAYPHMEKNCDEAMERFQKRVEEDIKNGGK